MLPVLPGRGGSTNKLRGGVAAGTGRWVRRAGSGRAIEALGPEGYSAEMPEASSRSGTVIEESWGGTREQSQEGERNLRKGGSAYRKGAELIVKG